MGAPWWRPGWQAVFLLFDPCPRRGGLASLLQPARPSCADVREAINHNQLHDHSFEPLPSAWMVCPKSSPLYWTFAKACFSSDFSHHSMRVEFPFYHPPPPHRQSWTSVSGYRIALHGFTPPGFSPVSRMPADKGQFLVSAGLSPPSQNSDPVDGSGSRADPPPFSCSFQIVGYS